MSFEMMIEGLRYALKELADTDPDVYEDLYRSGVDETTGQHLVELLAAPYRWRRAVGEVIDTTDLARLLGVTRQAIASRVKSGTLLALPGRTSRLYPTWQIDVEGRQVFPAVAALLSEWRRIEPDVEELTIATWATTANELLDERTPAELICDDDAVAGILRAARAAADRRTR
jgi:hypothetical protein